MNNVFFHFIMPPLFSAYTVKFIEKTIFSVLMVVCIVACSNIIHIQCLIEFHLHPHPFTHKRAIRMPVLKQ